MDIEVYPTVMDVLEELIFLDKLFRDAGEFDARTFREGDMGLEVNFLLLKLINRAPGLYMTLLAINLTILKEVVLVSTFPGHMMPFPSLVIWVHFLSSLLGLS